MKVSDILFIVGFILLVLTLACLIKLRVSGVATTGNAVGIVGILSISVALILLITASVLASIAEFDEANKEV
jgi:hypothetical protein